jgi:ADP-ribosylation factor protein 1
MPSSVPTIGLNIEQVQFRDYNLTFWDVGGQATKLWKHYFDTVDGLIFVIDSTDKTRIAKAKSELYRVAKDPALLQVPYLLLFNKIDIED